jgi:sugar lactone lactonase YvrE
MSSFRTLVATIVVAALVGCGDCNTAVPQGGNPQAVGQCFTSTGHFGDGTSVNLLSGSDGLRVSAETSTFPFVWIAMSNRGTIVKIDTETGAILGEYRTAPQTDGYPNPSRTTVSLDGSVWAGNRSTAEGSVIHVGLTEANQAIDRNGNGTIDTSAGYGDVLPWLNASGVDTDGGVETAEDEAILHFVRVQASGTRSISVNSDNDVWVSGAFANNQGVYQLIDSATGTVVRTEGPFFGGIGGYGALIDQNGLIWGATSSGASTGILRWDPDAALDENNPRRIAVPNYGLGIDSFGNVWVTNFGYDSQNPQGEVRKVSPDGNTIQGPFTHGYPSAQGCVCDGNNHVWVASSLSSGPSVGHLLNDGTFVGAVPVAPSLGPTGVAVDSNGKIWAACISSSTAVRIDPTQGGVGADETTPIGAVDLTVDLPATPEANLAVASPYNYSDMTVSVALGQSAQGTWTVVRDAGVEGQLWPGISWNTEAQGSEPEGTLIRIEARAADTRAGLGGVSFQDVTNGGLLGLIGRFIEVRVTLRASGGVSPVLSDICIETPEAYEPPVVEK